MKNKYLLAIKFHRETKNVEQLDLAYKEFDILLNIYHDFKWYLKFDVNMIFKDLVEDLVKW